MTGPAGARNAANADRPLVDVEVLGPPSTTGFADGSRVGSPGEPRKPASLERAPRS
jgi:hypothetical protein